MSAETGRVTRGIITDLLRDRVSAAAFLTALFFILLTAAGMGYEFYCAKAGFEPFYNRGNFAERFSPPSASRWMGTDYMGRDVFARALAGGATAVKIGVTASVISLVAGVALGVAGGYFRGKTDDFVVWLYSSFASMPTLLFILAFSLLAAKGFFLPPLAAALNKTAAFFDTDPGMISVYLGIGLTGWVGICRVVRAETFKIAALPYISAAKVLGWTPARIIVRHIIPNLFHLVIIYFTARFAAAVMTEVIISYLGLGVQTAPSWGVMIADGQDQLWRGVWWEVGAATFFMLLLVLSLNILGDALRDILDPRLKT
jgi:peptide/nickel transport system permease protein